MSAELTPLVGINYILLELKMVPILTNRHI